MLELEVGSEIAGPLHYTVLHLSRCSGDLLSGERRLLVLLLLPQLQLLQLLHLDDRGQSPSVIGPVHGAGERKAGVSICRTVGWNIGYRRKERKVSFNWLPQKSGLSPFYFWTFQSEDWGRIENTFETRLLQRLAELNLSKRYKIVPVCDGGSPKQPPIQNVLEQLLIVFLLPRYPGSIETTNQKNFLFYQVQMYTISWFNQLSLPIMFIN